MTPAIPKKSEIEILAAAVLVNIWLVYSGPASGDLPGFFPLLASVIVMTPFLLQLVTRSTPGTAARYGVIFGIVWFGMNPGNIETLMQPDSWRILACVIGTILGLLLYDWQPAWRRFGIF